MAPGDRVDRPDSYHAAGVGTMNAGESWNQMVVKEVRMVKPTVLVLHRGRTRKQEGCDVPEFIR
jgi:hypothetical protein